MKIGLLDHMGYGNLGDAATQDALIAHIKERVPDVVIIGFSLNPDDTTKRHSILCYPINWSHPGFYNSDRASPKGSNLQFRFKSILENIPVFSAIVRRTLHLVREAAHLGRSFRVLKSLDSLIIAGGGQLGELWRGPWSHPYNIFKFSVLAKLANKRLVFLNVGAGPLDRTFSRVFIKLSVGLADYVSFRDVESQMLVRGLGVKRETHVFPDSVYAFAIADHEAGNRVRVSRRLVGLSPIGFG